MHEADPQTPLRAAFVTGGNPRDIGLWSGIPFHMLQALEKRFTMAFVAQRPFASWFAPLGRALKLASFRRFEYIASPLCTKLGAHAVLAQLRQAKPDVVFAVSISPLTYPVARAFPTVHVADATVDGMKNYYEVFARRPRAALAQLDRYEQRVLDTALLSSFPSRWACESAIRHYGISPGKVVELAWGANLPGLAGAPRQLGEEIRFLFVGSDWSRKGGPIALETVSRLKERGVRCRLDVVGCESSAVAGAVPENVAFHGFVRKSEPEGRALFERLYRQATYFFLPTKAECWGIVFGEAAAQGLPSFGYATGGVTSVVRSGETGLLLPLGAEPAAFADAVMAVTPERYAAMSRAALADAAARLNWNVWARELEAAIRSRLPR